MFEGSLHLLRGLLYPLKAPTEFLCSPLILGPLRGLLYLKAPTEFHCSPLIRGLLYLKAPKEFLCSPRRLFRPPSCLSPLAKLFGQSLSLRPSSGFLRLLLCSYAPIPFFTRLPIPGPTPLLALTLSLLPLSGLFLALTICFGLSSSLFFEGTFCFSPLSCVVPPRGTPVMAVATVRSASRARLLFGLVGQFLVVLIPLLRIGQRFPRHVQLDHAPMGVRRLIHVGVVLLGGGGEGLLDLLRSRVGSNVEQVVVRSCLRHVGDSISPALLNVNGRGDGDGFWPSPE